MKNLSLLDSFRDSIRHGNLRLIYNDCMQNRVINVFEESGLTPIELQSRNFGLNSLTYLTGDAISTEFSYKFKFQENWLSFNIIFSLNLVVSDRFVTTNLGIDGFLLKKEISKPEELLHKNFNMVEIDASKKYDFFKNYYALNNGKVPLEFMCLVGTKEIDISRLNSSEEAISDFLKYLNTGISHDEKTNVISWKKAYVSETVEKFTNSFVEYLNH